MNSFIRLNGSCGNSISVLTASVQFKFTLQLLIKIPWKNSNATAKWKEENFECASLTDAFRCQI